MRLIRALRQDLSFQYRHGFYHAYLIIGLLYIALLLYIPEDFRTLATGLLLFSDPAMLGFFFVGAIILLEREEGIIEGLFVTPLRVMEYLMARVISLSALALVTAFLIAFIVLGSGFNYVLLLAGLSLTAIFFTLLGITLAVKVKTVNQYLISSILYSIIIAVPILEFLNIFDTFLFYLWPTRASLILILEAFGEQVACSEIIGSLLALLAWTIIGLFWANRSFYKYVILRIGEKT